MAQTLEKNMPNPGSLDAVYDREVLPMRAAAPRLMDWNSKQGLTPAQLQLLAAFQSLSFAAKSELTHGLTEQDSIPAYKIKLLYRQEQMRKQPRKKSKVESLEDTTKSDLA